METHRITCKTAKVRDIGEIVLIVADKKNRAEWRKGKVVRHTGGKGGVVRGLSLLHKGHHIDRPLNLVCPLEIRQAVASDKGVPTAWTNQNQKTSSWNSQREDSSSHCRPGIETELILSKSPHDHVINLRNERGAWNAPPASVRTGGRTLTS